MHAHYACMLAYLALVFHVWTHIVKTLLECGCRPSKTVCLKTKQDIVKRGLRHLESVGEFMALACDCIIG